MKLCATGNGIRVFCVTGRNTNHYTIADVRNLVFVVRIAHSMQPNGRAWRYDRAVVLDAWPNISTLGHCASCKIVMKQKLSNNVKGKQCCIRVPRIELETFSVLG